ncbi:MAG: hypothetical protein LBP92_07115 [Deltaproteobacteria bacterium]|jgi:hypothetical protein|nr:hypothetical protein [Deltaproteobacteria bacterium]
MSKNTAAQSMAASLSVSFSRSISPDELVRIFLKEADWQPWISHLDVFFSEVPASLIQRFMAENSLSFDQLAEIYNSLPPVWQGKLFREMRDAAMGSSA